MVIYGGICLSMRSKAGELIKPTLCLDFNETVLCLFLLSLKQDKMI